MKRVFFFLFFVVATPLVGIAQNIGGIGAMLALDSAEGYTIPYIKSLMAGLPAAASLKEHDFILKVNDTSCEDKTLEAVITMIRGAAGSHVKLTVADNKKGRHAKDYDLVRVGIPQPGNTPAEDHTELFYSKCNEEQQILRKQHHSIVKTFNSDCGDFFFNFNADTGLFHIRFLSLEDKGPYSKGFDATARIYNNNNEAGATELTKGESTDLGKSIMTRSDGDLRFSRAGVGVISTHIIPLADATSCKAMYVIVYR